MFVDLRLRHSEVQYRRELLSRMHPGRKPEKDRNPTSSDKPRRKALRLRQVWLSR